MKLSSRASDGRYGLVAPSVTQQCPQNVDSATREREDRLGVPFALRTLPVVKPARFVAASDADQRGVWKTHERRRL